MPTATEDRRWTMDEMHALPEDGNKHELVDGVLFVTPAPSYQHETIGARLHAIILPYVMAQNLGLVYRPRAVFRVSRRVEVEPDLMVRHVNSDPDAAWEDAPLPSLVVEIVSPGTRQRDFGAKRALYVSAGIAEYWIVDGVDRSITVIAPDREAAGVRDTLTWSPEGATQPLTFAVGGVFE